MQRWVYVDCTFTYLLPVITTRDLLLVSDNTIVEHAIHIKDIHCA